MRGTAQEAEIARRLQLGVTRRGHDTLLFTGEKQAMKPQPICRGRACPAHPLARRFAAGAEHARPLQIMLRLRRALNFTGVIQGSRG